MQTPQSTTARRASATSKPAASPASRRRSGSSASAQATPDVQPTANPAQAPGRFNPQVLTKLRERLGLSLRKTARLIGVSPRAVMLWERGIFIPKVEHQATLKNLTRLSKRELLDQLAAAS